MLVTAWILLCFFGLITITSTFKFLFTSEGLNIFHAIFWLISICVTAISAGVLWGGLFQ